VTRARTLSREVHHEQRHRDWGRNIDRHLRRPPSASSGRISIAAVGDPAHTGFDNIALASEDDVLVVEDAGYSLHAQRNALDSGYVYDISRDERTPNPLRWLADRRDSSATFDAAGGPSYNDGDNEITGIHVSDGDPGVGGLLGAKVPHINTPAWRTFWTQQHGDNVTWEVIWNNR
jgi:hypothetical protein